MQNDNNPPENKEEMIQSETENSSSEPESSLETHAAEETATASEQYQETAANREPEGRHQKSEPDSDSVVNLSDAAQIQNPFQAIQAIILKPNKVFARVKNTGNWSWVPFFVVVAMAILPSWLYFNTVDMDWYTNTIVEIQYGDVSPAEKAQAKQMMSEQSLPSLTVIGVLFYLIIANGVFAFYLYKITQIDAENVMSYGDWYGFTWWSSLPLAFVNIISLLVVMTMGHPELMPNYLTPLSLAFIFSVPMDSVWYGLTQGIGLESVWAVYLTAVGVSQWTKLNSKQCYIIAIAPVAIIWGVWSMFIIL